MRPSTIFKPFTSRYFSTSLYSPQNLTHHHILTLLSTLSCSPNDPTTLKQLDSILTHTRTHPQLEPTTSLLLLRGLSFARKLTRSKSLLSSLLPKLPHFFLYSTLLHCTLPNCTLSEADTVWAELHAEPVNPSNFVLYMCRHCWNAPQIEKLYSRISSSSCWSLSCEAHVALIGAVCRSDDPNPHLGRRVLNDMVERGMEPDDLSYFCLFASFCRVGDVMEADSVLRDWRSRREFEMDISIYGNFFHGLCKSGKFREAQKLFDKMTSRGALNSGSSIKMGRRVIFQLTYRGIVSEITAFEAYFRSLCRFGRVDDAERLLKAMMKKQTVPESCVYCCFIKALFKAGRVDDALRFFRKERKKGHVASGVLASSVIHGLCENGRVDDGYKLVSEMASEGFVPTARVWNRILRSYWEVGREEVAVRLFEEMRVGKCDGYGTRPDSMTYGMMVGKYLENGEVDKGIEILREMEGMKFKASVDLYSGVVRGLYKCGRVEESSKWMNQMIEDGVLCCYKEWESLYGSMVVEGDTSDGIGELWSSIETNSIRAREEEENKRRSKGKSNSKLHNYHM